jgi:hypothetical protein
MVQEEAAAQRAKQVVEDATSLLRRKNGSAIEGIELFNDYTRLSSIRSTHRCVHRKVSLYRHLIYISYLFSSCVYEKDCILFHRI